MIRPILELTVIIPGMLLAYLPVKECLKQAPVKLALWLTPLLLTLSLSGGIICYMLQLPVRLLLLPVLLLLMLIYHKTLQISIWKSSSIFLLPPAERRACARLWSGRIGTEGWSGRRGYWKKQARIRPA